MPFPRRTRPFCPGRAVSAAEPDHLTAWLVLDQPPHGRLESRGTGRRPISAVPCGILVPCLPVVCGWMLIPHRQQWLDGIPCGSAGTVLTGGNVSGGCLSGVLSPFVGNGECGENGERPFEMECGKEAVPAWSVSSGIPGWLLMTTPLEGSIWNLDTGGFFNG